MGNSYSLYCLTCKKSVWIGQRGGGSLKPWIYRLDEELDKLERFLQEHETLDEKHELIFAYEWMDEQIADEEE